MRQEYLLRLIAGLEEPTDGQILLGGRDVTDLPSAKRNIAMVFQSYALYPHMSVRKNMAFGLSLNGMPRAEIERRVAAAAQILQITELLERKPKQLSGGQRQRVAIGRAIVREPVLFLLDEPLSNLDAGLRVSMRVELAALHERLKTTMIYVTHDQVEAMTLSSRVVVLDRGTVSQFGTPLELFYRPANLFVAGFIGSPKMNFFETASRGADGQDITVSGEGFGRPVTVGLERPVPCPSGTRLTLGIRPDALEIVAAGSGHVAASVDLVERLGTESHVHLHLQASGQRVTAIVRGNHPVQSGDRVDLSFDPARCHLFDAGGEALPRALDAETRSLIDREKQIRTSLSTEEETHA
ncbi:multiple sugar transport system ATP-binding protein [Gellertiella hungarica]|uniref:Multiple sugar transport system ATP-binding protein n=1 Tax=Gellertiella hungarica TaxID=1572859 RepID=A0A7W6J505_9HYPH|nr:multiple sugar transport system ATP-binding protein [Gellertiella hungarica]